MELHEIFEFDEKEITSSFEVSSHTQGHENNSGVSSSTKNNLRKKELKKHITCKFWKRGNCPNGSNCRFMHHDIVVAMVKAPKDISSITSHKQFDALPRTACFTASVRANETKRIDALFKDPYAAALSFHMNFSSRSASKSPIQSRELPFVEVRTRYIDDLIQKNVSMSHSVCHKSNTRHNRKNFTLAGPYADIDVCYDEGQCANEATKSPLIEQIVLLGAGMDTRALRMNLSPSVTIYELDYEKVLDMKEKILAKFEDDIKCKRYVLGVDMNGLKWMEDLVSKCKFDSKKPTMWIAEGFLTYFTDAQVQSLLQLIDKHSARNSIFFADVFNQIQIEELNKTTKLTAYQDIYKSGYEYPENELLIFAKGSYKVHVVQLGDENEANYGRYKRKPTPRSEKSPRTYFVTAQKIK